MNDVSRTERAVRDWLAEADMSPSAEHVVDAILTTVPGIGQESASIWIGAARRTGVALAAVAVIVVSVVGLSVLIYSGSPTGRGGSPTPTTVPTPTTSPYLGSTTASGSSPVPGVITIDMHTDTWGMAIDERSVWVQVGDVGIGRIDRSTNTDTGIRVNEVPDMQFEGADLWALDVGTGIDRLDSLTGAILQTIPGISGYYIRVDGKTAWVTDTGHSLDRVDLASGKVVTTIDVPATPKEMAILDGSVWVVCDAGGSVARVDSRTNKVVAIIPAGNRPVNVAAGEGAIWVWNHDNELLRIDPNSNKVVATIHGLAPTLGAGVAVGGGSVWVATPTGIGRIDPARNSVIDVIPIGPGGYVDIAWFEGELWVSSTDRNLVYRINPNP